jgi:hypothetical protein
VFQGAGVTIYVFPADTEVLVKKHLPEAMPSGESDIAFLAFTGQSGAPVRRILY